MVRRWPSFDTRFRSTFRHFTFGVASSSGTSSKRSWASAVDEEFGRLLGLSAVANCPVVGSISACCPPSASSNHLPLGMFRRATCMKSSRWVTPIRAGQSELRTVVEADQTTQTSSGVYPANQPSREVPVFPATFAFKPRALTLAAVPRLTTSFINEVIT